MSVGDGFMIAMAAARTDTTTATSGDAVLRRRRGKSRAPNFTSEGPVSVIGLELDVSDSVVRRRVERQWAAVFGLRRAIQRDAAARCRAYWAAHHERGADAKAVRDRLGLSRNGIEAGAKAHIEASGWMRDHLTKAIGLHVADEVWESVDRHLFADASGRRHGPARIGSWWDFTRIPGRARSHTKTTPVWETWRLVGTLDGHLAGYRHRQLAAAVSTAAEAARQPAGTSILSQPTRLAAPVRPGSRGWADHRAVLAVVFTGLAAADMVLPVGLPHGAGQWAHLCHLLADPAVWHKIDLVRVRDRKAPGGWRYYAHLLVHQRGYQSAATRARRAEIPTGRRAGVDANVSNLAVASFPTGHPEQLLVDQISCTDEHRNTAAQAGAARRCAAQSVGSVAAQHQSRAVRRLGTPGRAGGSPRDERVAGQAGHQPRRAPSGPHRWGGAARLPPRPPLRQLSAHPHRSRRRRAGHQSGQTCPRPPGRGADRGHPRQHHHRRRLFDLHLGAPVGEADSVVQPRHARRRVSRRVRHYRRAPVSGQHPSHRHEPALPLRQACRENPGPAHP